ncbi:MULTISPECIES: hypothetical protein [Shewanella]|uniref:Uncharacterized protein n=1 Tax=Shewanella polaris TaxID=2588449 RepID=A0A4Y5YAI4_9GAMM|nr:MULTISPECIES: hypothetical protein [Shewanella]QDE29533.1 hypothetical protein FH971_00250 [Shewanella polaris]
MKNLIVMLGLAFMSLQGCQNQSAASKVDEQTDTEVVTKPLLKDCGPSGMPPLRDRTKLTENLRAQGLITADMDQAQIDKIVADYIAKRQKAFEKCHKPTPNIGK